MKVRFTVFLAKEISPGIKHEAVEEAEKHVTEHVTGHVTGHVKRLLICLEERPSGTKDVMQCLGLNHRPAFLYDYLRPAIQAGFVQMMQPDSPKSPTQKCRLTEKGRRCLKRRGLYAGRERRRTFTVLQVSDGRAQGSPVTLRPEAASHFLPEKPPAVSGSSIHAHYLRGIPSAHQAFPGCDQENYHAIQGVAAHPGS